MSTAHGLAIWANVRDRDRYAAGQSAQTQRTTFTSSNYGLGVNRSPDGAVGHNGTVPGLQSALRYQLSSGSTVIVLANLGVPPNTYLGDSGTANAMVNLIEEELLPR